MSTLVIEWDRDRLIVASGSAHSGGITLKHALTITRDPDATPEMQGAALRAALTDAGISETQVAVVLPRSMVTLRRIQLPNVGDDELPDMVRLQAATRLTVPVESICMDFVPLPSSGDTRDVLLATAPVEQIANTRISVESAGLELSGIHVSSFGIASALAHVGNLKSTSDTIEAVMSLRSDLIELLMIRQQSVVFSHSGASWSSTDQIEQAVRSEISRGRLAATEDIGPHTVRQLALIGSPEVTAAVPDEITKRLDNSTIQRLNPDDMVQGTLPDDLTTSDVLAAAGVIAGHSKSRLATVDLINPRKAAEKPDNRRLHAILAVGTALLLCVGAWKWRDTAITELDAKTRGNKSEASQLEQDFRAGEDDMDQDVAIQAWSAGNIDWLDEMNNVREIMGGTDRLLIREFSFAADQGLLRGTITAECLAKDQTDVREFYRRLEAAGYDVVNKGIQTGSIDQDYPMEFEMILNISHPEEEG